MSKNESSNQFFLKKSKILVKEVSQPFVMAFNLSNNELAIVGNGLSRWDIKSKQRLFGELEEIIGYPNLLDIAFNPDGTTLAGADDTGVMVWNVASSDEIIILASNNPAYCVVFDPTGDFLVSGHADRRIRFWDTKTWQNVKVLDAGRHNDVVSLNFNSNGSILISASADLAGLCISPDAILVWDAFSNEVKKTFETGDQGVVRTQLGNDKFLLALIDQGREYYHTVLVNIETEEKSYISELFSLNTSASIFGPNPSLIICGNEDGSIIILDVTIGEIIGKYTAHNSKITALAFNEAQNLLVSTSEDGTIIFWDTFSG